MKYTKYHSYIIIICATSAVVLFYLTGGFYPGGGVVPYLTELPSPEDSGWYIDIQKGVTESHYYVLKNNFGPSIENLRKADVVLLGDSRALLGFDWRQVEELHHKTGLRIFNLAIDGGTGWEFPLYIMKRYNIKPKIIIITVPEVLTNPNWIGAKDALNSSWLSGYKQVISAEISWRYKNLLSLVSPPQMKRFFPPIPIYSSYRSTKHGCWFRDNFTEGPEHYPITLATQSGPLTITPPKSFFDFLSACGTQVFLANIPNNIGNTAYDRQILPDLAAKLDLPFIEVSSDDLTTTDYAHLDKRSSEIFTYRFFDKFVEIPAIKEITVNHLSTRK
jgi:hypothetical protein